MKNHLVSFACNPVGYILNAIASALPYGPKIVDEVMEPPIVKACEFFCSKKDDIQQNPLF